MRMKRTITTIGITATILMGAAPAMATSDGVVEGYLPQFCVDPVTNQIIVCEEEPTPDPWVWPFGDGEDGGDTGGTPPLDELLPIPDLGGLLPPIEPPLPPADPPAEEEPAPVDEAEPAEEEPAPTEEPAPAEEEEAAPVDEAEAVEEEAAPVDEAEAVEEDDTAAGQTDDDATSDIDDDTTDETPTTDVVAADEVSEDTGGMSAPVAVGVGAGAVTLLMGAVAAGFAVGRRRPF